MQVTKATKNHEGHPDNYRGISLCDLPIAIGSANLVPIVTLHFISRCYSKCKLQNFFDWTLVSNIRKILCRVPSSEGLWFYWLRNMLLKSLTTAAPNELLRKVRCGSRRPENSGREGFAKIIESTKTQRPREARATRLQHCWPLMKRIESSFHRHCSRHAVSILRMTVRKGSSVWRGTIASSDA